MFCDIWQGYHCFGPWLPLGLVYFGFIGGIVGFGGDWGEVESCLICTYGGVGVGLYFCQEFSWFGPWIPLGILHFLGIGSVWVSDGGVSVD